MSTCPMCKFEILKCPQCGYATTFFPRHGKRGEGAHYAKRIARLNPTHQLALQVLREKGATVLREGHGLDRHLEADTGYCLAEPERSYSYQIGSLWKIIRAGGSRNGQDPEPHPASRWREHAVSCGASAKMVPSPMNAYDLACEGHGQIPAHFMFIGISAGRRGALVSKVPLTKDASGRLFQRCLNRLGLSESDEFSEAPILKDTYLTNLVKGCCLTVNGQNRLPTDNEISYWMPHLESEIEKVSPKIIILLGNFVYQKSVKIRWSIISDRRIVLRTVKHPRWYASHGGLAQNSPSFDRMLNDYKTEIFDGQSKAKLAEQTGVYGTE